MKKLPLKKILRLGVVLLFVLSLAGGYLLAQSQTAALPDNPLTQLASNRSHMQSSDGSSVLLPGEKLSGIPEPSINKANSGDTADTKNTEKKQNTGDAQSGETQTGNAQTGGSDPSPTGELPKNDSKTVYFTTSIKDGETVTDKSYSFTITHKVPELTVKEVSVYVNSFQQPQFRGSVLLSEGKNSIKVSVRYENDEGKAIVASKTYTVYVELSGIVITTDLENQTVSRSQISFIASASYRGKDAALTVHVNGSYLSSDDSLYTAVLSEGANTITLEATHKDAESARKTYTVFFETAGDPSVYTTLRADGQTVNDESFPIQALIQNATADCRLTVVLNGKTVTGDAGGSYQVSLNQGNNILRVKAQKNGATFFEQSYLVTFIRPDEHYTGPDSLKPTSPTLRTNITDGMEIKGTTLTLDVYPQDYHGNRIYASGVSVQLNGKNIPYQWDDAEKTSFRLTLISGPNTVSIKLTDEEGYNMIYTYTVNCTLAAQGEPIGKVTISIEATTVGLGQIIAPVEVTIYEGESAVEPLLRVLEQNGLEYTHTGTLTSSFYLSRLKRVGLGENVSIPEDLIAMIDQDGIDWTENQYSDSLGEFDYSKGSGWMYSINGAYPNHGFSECSLKDGDVMRIRFTLAYGKDIGGYSATGGSDNGSINSNYGKEW